MSNCFPTLGKQKFDVLFQSCARMALSGSELSKRKQNVKREKIK